MDYFSMPKSIQFLYVHLPSLLTNLPLFRKKEIERNLKWGEHNLQSFPFPVK